MKNLILSLICLFSLSACENKTYPIVEILTSDSGIIKKNDDGKPELTKTKIIPYKIGNSYYWRLAYRSNLPLISYTQEVNVEEKGVWGVKNTEKYEIYNGGRSIKMYYDDKKNTGFLYGFWTIAEGDPAGKVSIVVTIEKDVKRNFEYELVKDEK
jgi:hypothetical protein